MKFYDNHTHSEFSPDSRMTMEQSIAAAESEGLGGISITDHLDVDAPRDNNKFLPDIAKQQKRIGEIAARHPSIEVFKGIEIGLQPHSIEHIRDYVKGFDFDVVIASIHFVDGEDPYFGEYYRNKDYRQAYGRVLELIYSTALQYRDFDILGHFDYIARYAPYDVRDIRYRCFPDHIDAILKLLAQDGKALEINTNTYRERNGYTPVLDKDILKRFKELGGEAISLGSDAHDRDRIAENFTLFSRFAKDCGFDYLVHYKGRKALFSPITF